MAGDVPMTSCIGKVEEPLIITPGVGKYKKAMDNHLMLIEKKQMKLLILLLQFYVSAMVLMMTTFKHI